MRCKFCGTNEKLVKAHIIPRSLYGFPNEPGYAPFLIITNVKGHFKSKSPNGIYDSALVCKGCEELFNEGDKYAYKVFIKQRDLWRKVLRHGLAIHIPPSDFDYRKFKLFILSLLWRASETSQPFFGKIKLEQHTPIIRKMIEEGSIGSPDDYSINLAVFDSRMSKSMLLDPDRTRFSGINYVRFYLAGFMVVVKVDKRRAPSPLRELQASPESGLIAVIRDFQNSKELFALRKVANH